MAASVNPNSDPFRGGGKFVAGVPTSGPTGSIAPANTGGSLAASVTGGTPMLARNTRGTNVSIPYARVVLHPAGRTALPAAPDKQDPTQKTLGKPGGDLLVETEMLYSGRVTFILGRRAQTYADSAVDNLLGFEAMQTTMAPINSRHANMLHQFAVGGVDQHTMQRLCSFEYLERYFYHVLRKNAIDIGNGDPVVFTPAALPKKYAALAGLANAPLNNLNGKRIINKLHEKLEGAEAVKDDITNEVVKSGIFAGDDGPFLRGKTLENKTYKYRRHGIKDTIAIGDRIAFEVFEQRMKDAGLFDWAPDGIVLSKLDSGAGGDRLGDDAIDSRDGQLYNVTIGGPAVTSSWTGDPKMEVLPLDKVFIVILGDVWTGKNAKGADSIETLWAADKDGTKTYEDAFKEIVAADDRADKEKASGSTRGATFPAAADAPKNQAITNFRVKRMTSSQFVNYSAYVPNNSDSRLGLPIGKDGGTYILGGWCIGTVLDSAAARAMPDGMSLVGSVKRARSNHAANVLVDVKWCSADTLFRKYADRSSGKGTVSGTLRTRYVMGRRPLDNLNKPATERP